MADAINFSRAARFLFVISPENRTHIQLATLVGGGTFRNSSTTSAIISTFRLFSPIENANDDTMQSSNESIGTVVPVIHIGASPASPMRPPVSAASARHGRTACPT